MPDDIEDVHTTPNATPNNPNLLAGQLEIDYELMNASVDGMTNDVTIDIRFLGDGVPLDVANLPASLATPGRYPALLLAWALPQDGISTPLDYNNIGRRAAQPLSLDLDDFLPGGMLGTHSYDAGTGVNTFVVTDPASQFPAMATLRAVGLQGYFQQDIMGETVSLHTPSAVVAVTGDTARRTVVDSNKCANCHEWFEGHGGSRTLNMQICTLCHNPNLSSSGRTVVDPTLRSLDMQLMAAVTAGTLDPSVDPNDPTTYPEDAQNLKDLVHGIHSSGFRTRPFQHVRGPSRQDYYDWSHVTFPRGASTSNCSLCHDGESYELPLMDDLLPATVRTTGVANGQDATVMDAENAFVAVPNVTDWVNTPNSGSCVGCHTSSQAMAHMELNGGQLSLPALPLGTWWANRSALVLNLESCSVCHGPGKIADLELVHDF
jgi:OmcA/MtrC family decaheme c-type cytochrome